MALVELTAKSAIDALLTSSKTRNPDLRIVSDSAQLFKDPTIFVNDDTYGTIHAFSQRDRFWTWSFASSMSNGIPTSIEIGAIYQFAADLVLKRWGTLPFSAYLNDNCPWINELTSAKTIFTIADNITLGINSIVKNSVVRIDPPQQITVAINNSKVNLGLIYCHTVPLLTDQRGF